MTLVGVNRVVFLGENERDKKLRERITFTTTATVPAIMQELDTYVCAVDKPLGLSQVLYTGKRTDRGISWVYGSTTKVKLEAVVAFSTKGPDTEAIFVVTQWFEEDGLESDVDALKTLRMQLVAAFQAADPAVHITEGPEDKRLPVEFEGAFETTD